MIVMILAWVAGVLAYLFIGAFIGKVAASQSDDEDDSFTIAAFVLAWLPMMAVGLGMLAAKAVQKRRIS